jgi:hypothetical protein
MTYTNPADHLPAGSPYPSPLRILWTGGWDSTFQLLQLLTVHRAPVIPVYIIDAERRSTGVELLTMKRIKQRLIQKDPVVRDLLLPAQFYAMPDVAPNAAISQAFERLRARGYLSRQYDWLARCCAEHAMSDVQLCAHSDGGVEGVVKSMVSRSGSGGHDAYRFDDRHRGSAEHTLFSCFSFPIMHIPKLQMRAIASQQGQTDIMNMTWFCNNPRPGMLPCALCIPCGLAMKEGMGWRIPPISRVAGWAASRLVRPARAMAKARLGWGSAMPVPGWGEE